MIAFTDTDTRKIGNDEINCRGIFLCYTKIIVKLQHVIVLPDDESLIVLEDVRVIQIFTVNCIAQVGEVAQTIRSALVIILQGRLYWSITCSIASEQTRQKGIVRVNMMQFNSDR